MTADRRSRRGWPTVPDPPATPPPVQERRVSRLRLILSGLTFMVLVLAITVGVLMFYVTDLKAARDRAAADRQAAIDATFCRVLAELPAVSPPLERIRRDLRCVQPGLSPEQVKQLDQTGGTP